MLREHFNGIVECNVGGSTVRAMSKHVSLQLERKKNRMATMMCYEREKGGMLAQV